MRRLFPFSVVTAILCGLFVQSSFGTTYYIAAIGSDSNAGTSKTIPWAHAPGMAGCTGVCASTTPKPGDSFVLRRGDSWPINSPWNWSWGGNSSAQITIGATDPTWGSGNFATLDGGGEPCGSASSGFPGSNVAYPANTFFLSLGSGYVEVSFLEFKGLFWSAEVTGQIGFIEKNFASNSGHVLIDHNYFHCWSHTSAPGDGNVAAINCVNSGTADSTTLVYLNAWDGTDTAQDSMTGIYGPGCSNVYQNYFAYMITCAVGNLATVHDNTFVHCSLPPYDPGYEHNNAYESNTDQANGTAYNNLIIHSNSGAVILWTAPQSGNTTYAFNNVVVDSANGPDNRMCAYALSNPGGTCEDFNNTFECGPDSNPAQACVRMNCNGGSCPGAGTLINEHWVTSAPSPVIVDPGAPTPTQTATVLQTLSAANAQGYSLLQQYPFSPTSNSGATVGKGTNETAVCTVIAAFDASAGAACQQDTTLGVSYDTSTHLVSWPARSPGSRPNSGAWDVGAYYYGGVNPPTNLQSLVQ